MEHRRIPSGLYLRDLLLLDYLLISSSSLFQGFGNHPMTDPWDWNIYPGSPRLLK